MITIYEETWFKGGKKFFNGIYSDVPMNVGEIPFFATFPGRYKFVQGTWYCTNNTAPSGWEVLR